MRPELEAILQVLVAAHRGHGPGPAPGVDLDAIADAVGTLAVSYEEVDALVEALEASGLRVGELPSDADIALVRQVLAAARGLTTELGHSPSLGALSARVGRHPIVVRSALRQATRARGA
jgi:hypothetical protein